MGQYVCMVQEGQKLEGRKAALEKGLRTIAQRAFGHDPSGIEIRWTRIARGFGFTGGEPSTSSLVVGSVPVGLPAGQRETFMREISAMWSKETGCTLDEIVVTAWDGPLPI